MHASLFLAAMKTRSQTAAAAAGGDDGGGEDPRRHMKAREELFRKLPLSRPGDQNMCTCCCRILSA